MPILFDLDDTLLDDSAAKNHYMPKLYEHFKEQINYDKNVFYSKWREAIPKYHKMYADGLMTFEEQRRERVRESFGNITLSDSDLLNIITAFDTYFKEGWQPFYNTIEILEHFKNEQLGIITNGSSKHQNEKIDTLEIRNYFTCILISGEEMFPKPDKRIFLKACRSLKCEPEDCFFVGDSWESDVIGSNKSGMKSVWLNRYKKEIPLKLNNFHMISDLSELKNFIY